MTKIAFIGMGNMAQAIVKGIIKSEKVMKENLLAYAPNQDKLKKNSEIYGFVPYSDIGKLISDSDVIIIACKPYQIEAILKEYGSSFSGKNLLSVAAGWDFAKYKALLPENVSIQFVMPNTPAMVGKGVFLFEKTNSFDENERKQIIALFMTMGLVEELPSNLMGIGGAVTGCGPAFVDLMIEAYADAAVKYGISRASAYKLVSQTVLGSAALCLETGEHPAVLKDAVCSPNGTTIRGVAALEENGFRNSCIKSIDAIMEFKKN